MCSSVITIFWAVMTINLSVAAVTPQTSTTSMNMPRPPQFLPSTIPTLIVMEATASAHPLLSQSTRSISRPFIGIRIVTPVPSQAVTNKIIFTNVDQTKN